MEAVSVRSTGRRIRFLDDSNDQVVHVRLMLLPAATTLEED